MPRPPAAHGPPGQRAGASTPSESAHWGPRPAPRGCRHKGDPKSRSRSGPILGRAKPRRSGFPAGIPGVAAREDCPWRVFLNRSAPHRWNPHANPPTLAQTSTHLGASKPETHLNHAIRAPYSPRAVPINALGAGKQLRSPDQAVSIFFESQHRGPNAHKLSTGLVDGAPAAAPHPPEGGLRGLGHGLGLRTR